MHMADSFMMATLFPDAAMRVILLAEPLSCEPMEEKVSDCIGGQLLIFPFP